MNIEIDEQYTETKIHGKKLVDNYKWMKTNKPKAVKLIKQLNKDTEQFHDKLSPIQKQLAKEIKCG